MQGVLHEAMHTKNCFPDLSSIILALFCCVFEAYLLLVLCVLSQLVNSMFILKYNNYSLFGRSFGVMEIV